MHVALPNYHPHCCLNLHQDRKYNHFQALNIGHTDCGWENINLNVLTVLISLENSGIDKTESDKLKL